MAKSELKLDFECELKGEFYWELYLDVDNTKNSGSIERVVEQETVVSLSYNAMVKSVQSSTIGTEMGLDVGGIFDVISVGVKGSISSEIKSEYENITNTKSEKTITTKKKDTITVGANSYLKLYRLAFKGPGLAYTTDTLSTSTDTLPEVPIQIKGRRIPVLKEIDVVYTDDSISRPKDLIEESRGHSPDISRGWNEVKFRVWLRAIWTLDLSEGATGIQLAVQDKANESYKDLAGGAGGAYRYLKMLQDPHSKRRITEVALWRRVAGSGGAEFSLASEPWKFATEDINVGRNGDDLFLVWNVKEIQ